MLTAIPGLAIAGDAIPGSALEGGGASITVNASVATVSIVGQSVTITTAITANAVAAGVSILGVNPTATTAVTANAIVASVVAVGQNGIVATGLIVHANVASVSIIGQNATVVTARIANASVANVSIVAKNPNVTTGTNLTVNASVATVSVMGQNAAYVPISSNVTYYTSEIFIYWTTSLPSNSVNNITTVGAIDEGGDSVSDIVIESTDGSVTATEISPGVWDITNADEVGPQGPAGPDGPEGPVGPVGPPGSGGGGGGSGGFVVASGFLSEPLTVNANALTVLASAVVASVPAIVTAVACFDMTDAAGDIDIYVLSHEDYTEGGSLTPTIEDAAFGSTTCTQSPNQTEAVGALSVPIFGVDQYDLVCYTTVAGFVASDVSETGGSNATGITVVEQ